MARNRSDELSRRERQIMDVVYRRGRATAADVLADLPDPPSYSAVRALLRILEEKGHLRHVEAGPRYVFQPTVPRERARASALDSMLATFFDGRPGLAAAALLDRGAADLTDDELDRLQSLIARARKEGR